ncbi:MAG TPA: hypothetical protein VFN89_05360 [Solirubrobacterales bacterium]|nr:hypothetical protein [Solirubrobacterales bacterium]
MGEAGSGAFRKICCLLHSLGEGGATWHWVRLLAHHVERGDSATIIAQPGPLAEVACSAAIDVSPVSWSEGGSQDRIWRTVGEHDVAIVQWELGPVDIFARTLETCGGAALAVHGAPQTATRRLAPPGPMKLRRAIERAAADPRAVALVCGAAHRRKVAAAYGIPTDALRVMPASVPLQELSFDPAVGEPRKLLAMTRLAPEKMAIVRLAVELTRERLASGGACRLAVVGDGPRRAEAVELCERRLPPGSWQVDGAPADPIAQLAASDLIVAQGMTTLEGAALGRRVVVARSLGAREASGAVLTPNNYDEAARDPFGGPRVTEDAAQLWDELLAVDQTDLTTLRQLVQKHNSLEVTAQALDQALAAA